MTDRTSAAGNRPAHIEIVHMNYRYAGAWNEVNARIAQRQNAVTMFVTLSSVVVTVLISSDRKSPVLDPNWIYLLILVASLVFGFLNYKHDKTISLLRSFMADCEKSSQRHYPEAHLLGYNSEPIYRKHADSIRSFHDYSCAVLIIIFNALGLYSAYHTFPAVFAFSGWPFILYLAVVAWAIYLVMRSTWRPYVFPSGVAAQPVVPADLPPAGR